MNTKGILAPGFRFIADLFQEKDLPDQANAGLVFDRYLDLWDDTGISDIPGRKMPREPLDRFAKEFNRLAKDPVRNELLDMVHKRRKRATAEGSRSERYQTTWRLATGLGTDHPSENGFVFDPLIGVPVLPGSGIKGLCRQAALILGKKEGVIIDLFGPEPESSTDEATQGVLIFYNAYPVHWPRLCVDVINCHHPSYYRELETSQPKKVVPDETESPVPVFFLAVDSGVIFEFCIGLRGNREDSILDIAFELLDFGLATLGFGTKTAVGYGVMKRPENDSDIGKQGSANSWLNKTLKELMERHNASEDTMLRSIVLADTWDALEDGKEKHLAFEEIKKQWEIRGWWENPRGKAIKKARSIYAQYGAE
jgi:CRISPR-associated protein Cmr6